MITLARPVSRVKYVMLEEEIARGQRVEGFRIEAYYRTEISIPYTRERRSETAESVPW